MPQFRSLKQCIIWYRRHSLDLSLILHLYQTNISMKGENSSLVKKQNMELLLKYLKLNWHTNELKFRAMVEKAANLLTCKIPMFKPALFFLYKIFALFQQNFFCLNWFCNPNISQKFTKYICIVNLIARFLWSVCCLVFLS